MSVVQRRREGGEIARDLDLSFRPTTKNAARGYVEPLAGVEAERVAARVGPNVRS